MTPYADDAQEVESPPRPRLQWHSQQHFEDSLAAAMAHGHDEPTGRERAEAARYVARQLPPAVFERLSQNRVTEFHSHANSDALKQHWHELTKEYDHDINGFYDSETGHVTVNGWDYRGTLAHELGHAIDSSGLGGYWQASTSDEFRNAWRRELTAGALSDYATTDPTEGFAEVCRFLYAEPNGKERLAKEFPRTYAVVKQFGMV